MTGASITLVLFLKYSCSGGAVAVSYDNVATLPYDSMATCQHALEMAKKMTTFADGACISGSEAVVNDTPPGPGIWFKTDGVWKPYAPNPFEPPVVMDRIR